MGYAIACEALVQDVRNSGTACLAISGAEIVFTSKYTHHGPDYRSVICVTYNRAHITMRFDSFYNHNVQFQFNGPYKPCRKLFKPHHLYLLHHARTTSRGILARQIYFASPFHHLDGKRERRPMSRRAPSIVAGCLRPGFARSQQQRCSKSAQCELHRRKQQAGSTIQTRHSSVTELRGVGESQKGSTH